MWGSLKYTFLNPKFSVTLRYFPTRCLTRLILRDKLILTSVEELDIVVEFELIL